MSKHFSFEEAAARGWFDIETDFLRERIDVEHRAMMDLERRASALSGADIKRIQIIIRENSTWAGILLVDDLIKEITNEQ